MTKLQNDKSSVGVKDAECVLHQLWLLQSPQQVPHNQSALLSPSHCHCTHIQHYENNFIPCYIASTIICSICMNALSQSVAYSGVNVRWMCWVLGASTLRCGGRTPEEGLTLMTPPRPVYIKVYFGICMCACECSQHFTTGTKCSRIKNNL